MERLRERSHTKAHTQKRQSEAQKKNSKGGKGEDSPKFKPYDLSAVGEGGGLVKNDESWTFRPYLYELLSMRLMV